MDKKIKLIIVDFHGVMLKGSMAELSKYIAKKYKQDWHKVYEVVYHDLFNRAAEGKISEAQFFRQVAKIYPQVGDYQALRNYHINAQKLNKPVFNLCLKYKKLGYKILLLSKNTSPQFRDYKKIFQLRKYFKYIINTVDLGLPKASPETIDYILKKFNLRPEQVIFCDDQENNLVEPKKIGIKIIWYKSFSQFKKKLAEEIK